MKKIMCMVLFLAVFAAGCATIGRDFNVANVSLIVIGKTTQENIREMFGSPWRTGIDDGQRTWTYGQYRYSIFKQPSTRDLVIRFDAGNVVSSFTFNTTEFQEPEISR